MNKGLIYVITHGLRANCYVREKYSDYDFKCIKLLRLYDETMLLCVYVTKRKDFICSADVYIMYPKYVEEITYQHNFDGCEKLDNLCNNIATYKGQDADVLLGSEILIKLDEKQYARISKSGSILGTIDNESIFNLFNKSRLVQLVGELRKEVILNMKTLIGSKHNNLTLNVRKFSKNYEIEHVIWAKYCCKI